MGAMNVISRIVVGGTALLLVACASNGPVRMYDGAAKAASEVALVRMPEQVQVMAVDGKETGGGMLQQHQSLEVLPGERVFSLRYVELFQVNSEEHEVIRSRPAALRFTAEPGAEYRIEYDRQASLDEAKKFAKSPAFRLVNVKSGAVSESATIKSYAEASLLDTISKAFESSGEDPRQQTHLDLLKDVWGRASPEERSAFREWVEQQAK